ncbi:hypothetical protein GCM10023196_095870 [Actinoallomurus vinaceus]|uniref:Uncharacterized protein n=1 Tax=Actinoallomurus vinaceus TaxID=1080074 RepID=A0ABP8USZ9_9ACTN
MRKRALAISRVPLNPPPHCSFENIENNDGALKLISYLTSQNKQKIFSGLFDGRLSCGRPTRFLHRNQAAAPYGGLADYRVVMDVHGPADSPNCTGHLSRPHRCPPLGKFPTL